MATIEVLSAGGTWNEIDYQDFSISVPLSPVGIAPSASVTTRAQASVSEGQDVRIQINGTTRFEGVVASGGEIGANGSKRLTINHPAVELFQESVSISVFSSPDDESVLQQALFESSVNNGLGGSFSIAFGPTPTALSNDYDVSNRTIKNIFRDMADRIGWVWWVDPVSKTITVQAIDARGSFATLTPSDGASVRSFNEGSVGSVRNDVTVTGTGGVSVEATSTDSTSITNYGRQSDSFNVSYITSTSEAQDMADSLIVTDPLPTATVVFPATVGGGAYDPIINQTVGITDSSKGINATDLTVIKQRIEEGRVTIDAGRGSGKSIEDRNRRNKSEADTTDPGSIYDTDRIADLAIEETKINNGSIKTPKLFSEAVTAAKIDTDTITANEIDVLDLDTNELTIGTNLSVGWQFDSTSNAGNTVATFEPTADAALIGRTTARPDAFLRDTQIRNIGLSSNISGITPNSDNSGNVGSSALSFDEMWAYEFFDANTGTALDGGSTLPGVTRDGGYPDHLTPDSDADGVSINRLSRHLWEVVCDLNREREALQERVDDLEARLDALEGDNT